jgi:hypothetical protein
MISVLVQGSRVQTLPRAMDFKGDKIPLHTFLRRVSKAVDPMSKEFTTR